MNTRHFILYAASAMLMLAVGCSKDDDIQTTSKQNSSSSQSNSAIYPVAAFSATVNNMTVNVSSTSTNATALYWSWGDGSSSTAYSQSGKHTYSTAGTYRITLTAESSTGHRNSTSRVVTVYPTTVKITGLELHSFPAAPSSGAWDVAGKPDIYFTIDNDIRNTTYYTSSTKLNVNNSDCPLTWYTNCVITNISDVTCLTIRFYDEDDILEDEYMAGALWYPASESNNYGSKFNWYNSSIPLDFTIYMTWYSSKGETQYSKSADYVNGKWETDDEEVKQLLGL